jgi:hypothetical protein
MGQEDSKYMCTLSTLHIPSILHGVFTVSMEKQRVSSFLLHLCNHYHQQQLPVIFLLHLCNHYHQEKLRWYLATNENWAAVISPQTAHCKCQLSPSTSAANSNFPGELKFMLNVQIICRCTIHGNVAHSAATANMSTRIKRSVSECWIPILLHL